MATTPPVGQNSSTNDTQGTTNRTGGLGREAFLQLLVTQLAHQDPLKPQEDGAFIAQLAQFSSLEQLRSMTSQLTNFGTALGVPADDASETSQA